MEKKLVITVVILTALLNVFFFLHISNRTIDKLLSDKTTVSFRFHTNEQDRSKTEFLNKIRVFSEENKVEIAQYSFLTSDKIDIYSTMEDKYKEILFVPNFVFNRDIKVHNFEEIFDVGFKNILYIDTSNTDIIKKFSETLKNDCDLYYSKTALENNIFSFDELFRYKDLNFPSILSFYLFAFMVVVLFYYSISKKRYFIYKLWGYREIRIYCILNKPLYISLLLTIVLSNLVMSGIIYKFSFSSLLFEVFLTMLKLDVIIILLISILLLLFFRLFCFITISNRKKGLTKMMAILYFPRIILFFAIIFSFEQFFYQNTELKETLDGLTLWNNTENLYNLYETYSPYYVDNLAAEDILNEKFFRVYKELSDSDKVFIIKTTNFERPRTNVSSTKSQEGFDYSYKINMESEEDLYSPYGKNIVVDKNYLKRHIIKSLDGKNVLDTIDNNDNVLNILVPFKFKHYENIIENSFKEWFYFQKVEVPNIYRESKGQNKIKKNINDLKINIVYTKNGQNVFTYNPNSGDNFNIISDPIITVYTENLDNSFLAACFGDYIFIESTGEYSALKEISAITQKYNVIELNSISSVYDKKGEEIRTLESEMNNLVLNTIIIFCFLIMLMIIIVYIYYEAFFPKIIIEFLHGYSFFQIYKHLLLTNLIINTFTLFMAVIVYKKITLYMIIITTLMSFADYVVEKIINGYLLIKGEIQFAKGRL
ncbi:MAG: DUF1430 domain-containing protein [Eubacteriales bacterium]|nr:DUF1430 domain-containing protein [Eubacteriales bacterium]